MYRSVQIWFQNTRNRKKRLANFLNNCDPIAVDYSNEFSQTTTTTDEYSNYSQEAVRTPRNVIKSQNYNEPTTPAPKTTDDPNNKDNPPFVNQPTASVPDLPSGTMTTRSAEEKQDKVDPQQQQKSRPTIIKTMVESKLISKENNMQRVTDDEEENTSAKKD